MLKKLLMLSLFCVGCCQPNAEQQSSLQKNSRIKMLESNENTLDNAYITIVEIDNIEYIIVYKRWSDGGVAIVKHEKPNKVEVE